MSVAHAPVILTTHTVHTVQGICFRETERETDQKKKGGGHPVCHLSLAPEGERSLLSPFTLAVVVTPWGVCTVWRP